MNNLTHRCLQFLRSNQEDSLRLFCEALEFFYQQAFQSQHQSQKEQIRSAASLYRALHLLLPALSPTHPLVQSIRSTTTFPIFEFVQYKNIQEKEQEMFFPHREYVTTTDITIPPGTILQEQQAVRNKETGELILPGKLLLSKQPNLLGQALQLCIDQWCLQTGISKPEVDADGQQMLYCQSKHIQAQNDTQMQVYCLANTFLYLDLAFHRRGTPCPQRSEEFWETQIKPILAGENLSLYPPTWTQNLSDRELESGNYLCMPYQPSAPSEDPLQTNQLLRRGIRKHDKYLIKPFAFHQRNERTYQELQKIWILLPQYNNHLPAFQQIIYYLHELLQWIGDNKAVEKNYLLHKLKTLLLLLDKYFSHVVSPSIVSLSLKTDSDDSPCQLPDWLHQVYLSLITLLRDEFQLETFLPTQKDFFALKEKIPKESIQIEALYLPRQDHLLNIKQRGFFNLSEKKWDTLPSIVFATGPSSEASDAQQLEIAFSKNESFAPYQEKLTLFFQQLQFELYKWPHKKQGEIRREILLGYANACLSLLHQMNTSIQKKLLEDIDSFILSHFRNLNIPTFPSDLHLPDCLLPLKDYALEISYVDALKIKGTLRGRCLFLCTFQEDKEKIEDLQINLRKDHWKHPIAVRLPSTILENKLWRASLLVFQYLFPPQDKTVSHDWLTPDVQTLLSALLVYSFYQHFTSSTQTTEQEQTIISCILRLLPLIEKKTTPQERTQFAQQLKDAHPQAFSHLFVDPNSNDGSLIWLDLARRVLPIKLQDPNYINAKKLQWECQPVACLKSAYPVHQLVCTMAPTIPLPLRDHDMEKPSDFDKAFYINYQILQIGNPHEDYRPCCLALQFHFADNPPDSTWYNRCKSLVDDVTGILPEFKEKFASYLFAIGVQEQAYSYYTTKEQSGEVTQQNHAEQKNIVSSLFCFIFQLYDQLEKSIYQGIYDRKFLMEYPELQHSLETFRQSLPLHFFPSKEVLSQLMQNNPLEQIQIIEQLKANPPHAEVEWRLPYWWETPDQLLKVFIKQWGYKYEDEYVEISKPIKIEIAIQSRYLSFLYQFQTEISQAFFYSKKFQQHTLRSFEQWVDNELNQFPQQASMQQLNNYLYKIENSLKSQEVASKMARSINFIITQLQQHIFVQHIAWFDRTFSYLKNLYSPNYLLSSAEQEFPDLESSLESQEFIWDSSHYCFQKKGTSLFFLFDEEYTGKTFIKPNYEILSPSQQGTEAQRQRLLIVSCGKGNTEYEQFLIWLWKWEQRFNRSLAQQESGWELQYSSRRLLGDFNPNHILIILHPLFSNILLSKQYIKNEFQKLYLNLRDEFIRELYEKRLKLFFYLTRVEELRPNLNWDDFSPDTEYIGDIEKAKRYTDKWNIIYENKETKGKYLTSILLLPGNSKAEFPKYKIPQIALDEYIVDPENRTSG